MVQKYGRHWSSIETDGKIVKIDFYAHVLNLVFKDATAIYTEAKNLFELLEFTSTFIHESLRAHLYD